MAEPGKLTAWRRRSAFLELARPVFPVLCVLAALHLTELMVVPLLIFFSHEALGLVVPLAIGVVARGLHLRLNQWTRRRLRGAFMVRAASDALNQRSPAEAGSDSAFWGAHIFEYAICIDLPLILGAGLGVSATLVLAALRVGTEVIAPTAIVLALAMLAGLGANRLRQRQVDAIVERRQDMAIWMAAAMQDVGEISTRRATASFLETISSRALSWSNAEDVMERRQAAHRSLIVAVALAALVSIAHRFGLTQGLSTTMTVDSLAGVLLLGALLPSAYSLATHLESLAVAHSELERLLPQQAALARRGTAPLESRPKQLTCSDIFVEYAGALALELKALRLDLSRPLVITGPNGSGKTTFAKLVAGVALPSRGELEIDGVAPFDLDPDHVAYVPQDPVLIDALSVYENVRLVAPECSREQARDALRQLGMNRADTALDETAGSFSRGECRRIATARALLRQPRLLVLDEPDAWLDVSGRARLFDAVLGRAASCSIVVISHRMDVITRFEQILALSAAHQVEALGALCEVEASSAAFREIRDGASPAAPDQ